MTVKSKNENCFPPRSTLHGKEEKLSMVTIALDTQSDATKMSDIKHQQFVEEISAVLGEIMNLWRSTGLWLAVRGQVIQILAFAFKWHV